MKNKLILIACFALALSACGCLEQTSSDSAVEFKSSSLKETTEANEENETINTSAPLEKNKPTVIAYYFHRTMRCPTCLAIEANAARVLEDRFGQQIADGKLMWIPYNLDEPGGDELEKEFDVSVSILVLAKVQDGNHTKYKKLEKVWDYISKPAKFDEYVQGEVKEFLNE